MYQMSRPIAYSFDNSLLFLDLCCRRGFIKAVWYCDTEDEESYYREVVLSELAGNWQIVYILHSLAEWSRTVVGTL